MSNRTRVFEKTYTKSLKTDRNNSKNEAPPPTTTTTKTPSSGSSLTSLLRTLLQHKEADAEQLRTENDRLKHLLVKQQSLLNKLNEDNLVLANSQLGNFNSSSMSRQMSQDEDEDETNDDDENRRQSPQFSPTRQHQTNNSGVAVISNNNAEYN